MFLKFRTDSDKENFLKEIQKTIPDINNKTHISKSDSAIVTFNQLNNNEKKQIEEAGNGNKAEIFQNFKFDPLKD